MRILELYLAFISGLLLLSASAPLAAQEFVLAQSKHDRDMRIEAALTAVRQLNFTGVVGFDFDGIERQYHGFGRVLDLGIPPELLQTDILSITKSVTAVMVLKLIEQKQLSLQHTIGDHFLDIPKDKVAITIHQLLTHSAGFKESVGDDSSVIGKDDYIEKALNSRLRFEPGTSYRYSNIGYSLLAAIIEDVSGQEYQDFLVSILSPISDITMGYTNKFDTEFSLTNRRGRAIDRVSWGQDRAYWNLIGNGGLVATTKDMLDFRERLNEGYIISLESLSLMQTRHQQEVPDETFYGYGVVVDHNAEFGNFVWHNGGNNAFSSFFAYLKEYGISVYVAATGNEDADSVARTFLYELLAK